MSEWSLPEPSGVPDSDESTLQLIREALQNLKFGTVTLIVQDGLVIQVDRTERRRIRDRRKS